MHIIPTTHRVLVHLCLAPGHGDAPGGGHGGLGGGGGVGVGRGGGGAGGEGVGVSGVVNLHIITQFSKRFVFIHRLFNGY